MAREEKAQLSGRPHNLTLEGRRRAIVSGVEGVDSCNEQTVVLLTTAGALTLLGEELHIAKLNLEEGQLLVDGNISALEYDDRAASGRGGLFRRMLK